MTKMLTGKQIQKKFDCNAHNAYEILKIQALGYEHGKTGKKFVKDDLEDEFDDDVASECRFQESLVYADEDAVLRIYRAAVRAGKAGEAPPEAAVPPPPGKPCPKCGHPDEGGDFCLQCWCVVDHDEPTPVKAPRKAAKPALVPPPVAAAPPAKAAKLPDPPPSAARVKHARKPALALASPSTRTGMGPVIVGSRIVDVGGAS